MDGERTTLAAEDSEAVDAVTNLLGLPLPTARRVLLERQINVRGNVTDIPLRLPEVSEAFVTQRKSQGSDNILKKVCNYLKKAKLIYDNTD